MSVLAEAVDVVKSVSGAGRTDLEGFIRSDDPTLPKVGDYFTASIGGDSYGGIVTAVGGTAKRPVVDVEFRNGKIDKVKFYKGHAGKNGAKRWRIDGCSYMTVCFGRAIDKWDPSF